MILYFDNYITDAPLFLGGHAGIGLLRNSCKNYSMPSKLDITLYLLGWEPKIKFKDLVRIMARSDLEKVKEK